MATTKTKTKAADETALARTGGGGALAALGEAPAWSEAGSTAGRENIDQSDVIVPRLGLCQSTTPQRKRSDPGFMEGLEEGMFFNPVTREIYGAPMEPLYFTPISLGKRAMILKDFKDGGGIVERSIPWDDPRCEWKGDAQPEGTRFYDWFGLIHRDGVAPEMVILSWSKTKIKPAKQLTSFVNASNREAWAARYKLTPVLENGPSGEFFNVRVDPAAWNQDPALAEHCARLAQLAAKAGVQAAGDDGDRAASAGGAPTGAKDEKIPF